MEYLNYYNELLTKLNILNVEYMKTIRILRESRAFIIDFKNPIDLVIEDISNLRELGKQNNFDLFSEESYLKYIYIAYLDSIVSEMGLCFQNLLSYVKSNKINRILHKKLVDESVEAFNDYNILLNIFNPELVLEFYAMLLEENKYFSFFKPGMHYKYMILIMNELKEFGIDTSKERALNYVKYYIDLREKELGNKMDSIDYDTFNKEIEEKSKQYHVDFVGLDKNYTYEKRDNDDEKNKGNSRTRK